jgi:hypothetical protein
MLLYQFGVNISHPQKEINKLAKVKLVHWKVEEIET